MKNTTVDQWKEGFSQNIRQAFALTRLKPEDVAEHLGIKVEDVADAAANTPSATMETQIGVLQALGVKVTVHIDNAQIVKGLRRDRQRKSSPIIKRTV